MHTRLLIVYISCFSVQREQYSASSLIPRWFSNGLGMRLAQSTWKLWTYHASSHGYYGVWDHCNDEPRGTAIHTLHPTISFSQEEVQCTPAQRGWGDRTIVTLHYKHCRSQASPILSFFTIIWREGATLLLPCIIVNKNRGGLGIRPLKTQDNYLHMYTHISGMGRISFNSSFMSQTEI